MGKLPLAKGLSAAKEFSVDGYYNA